MTEEWIITKRFRGNSAYVNVRGVIRNPETQERAPFSLDCMVDTGCAFGLFSEEGLRSDAEIVGVKPTPTNIKLGDGTKAIAYVCVAFIEGINDFNILHPGQKVHLYMRGTSPSYLGMEALRSWITLFDGPNQMLKMKQ